MDQDRINGIGRQIMGAAKAGLGRIIGDAKLTTDGTAQRAAGKAQAGLAAARDPNSIDQDRVAGVAHQLHGAVEQTYGRLVNDPSIEQAGEAERAAGKSQNAAGSARDEARDIAAPKD